MNYAIEMHSVEYHAGKDFKIPSLSLRVPTGSIYGFLGPNGSGKTTSIRLMLGLLRARSGRISVLGHDMPGESARALARVGYVPERPHVYPSLTVGDAIRLHSAFHLNWDAVWAAELAREFRLHSARRVGSLSKGETGKLLVLLALAQRPELLVLDEPTDGLDPVVRRDLLSAILRYVSERQATVFISSHLIHELERICDWVGVMDQGQLVAELPMHEFKDGIKRLRVRGAPVQLRPAPFHVLARMDETSSENGAESWIVRGWQDGMQEYFNVNGTTLHEVRDLDLEDAFVEVLRGSRRSVAEEVR